MKYSRNIIIALAAGLVMLLATACGGGSMTSQSVAPQLEEARKLNSELSANWQTFDTTYNTTLQAVETFPQITIPKEKLDVELLKTPLTECFDASADASGDAAKGGEAATGEEAMATGEKMAEAGMVACETESSAALNDLAQKGDEEVSGFITQKLQTVATIKTNLKDKLPSLATQIAEQFATTKLKAEEIRVTAEGIKTAADNNPLMSDADKAKFNQEYEELQTELTQLDELLGTMQAEATQLPDKVRVTLEKATYAVSNFGQVPAEGGEEEGGE